MSLICELRINNRPPMAVIVATRIKGSEEPDSVNEYRWSVQTSSVPVGGQRGVVEHRYGDGAVALLHKVLVAAEGEV